MRNAPATIRARAPGRSTGRSALICSADNGVSRSDSAAEPSRRKRDAGRLGAGMTTTVGRNSRTSGQPKRRSGPAG